MTADRTDPTYSQKKMPGGNLANCSQAERRSSVFYFKAVTLDIPGLSISVEQIRQSQKQGSVVAYADVRIGPVVVRGIAIAKNKNGEGLFIALPIIRGFVRKFPVIEIDGAIRAQLFHLVLEAWKEFSKQ